MASTLTARVRRHLLDVELTLDLQRSPVTVLFGPSGAGKTTLLRVIAGLDRPEPGSRVALDEDVWCDERTRVPTRGRRVGFLFQEHALFPHLSVAENVGYGLRHTARADKQTRIRDALERAGAAHLLPARVADLSGGEKQRVALARALAPAPRLLLLDEPFSALDTPTRARLRRELRAVVRDSRTPAIVVTHDRTEALALADSVLVLLDGRVRQHDTVENAFGRPVDPEVAAAVGTETTAAGQVSDTRHGITYVDVHGVTLAATSDRPLASGTPVIACIRAENVALTTGDPGGAAAASPRNHLPAVVVAVTDHGPVLRVDLDAGFPLAAYITRPARDDLALAPGVRVDAVIKAPAIHLVARD